MDSVRVACTFVLLSLVCVQDAVEFEEAAKLKPNTPRNDRRLNLLTTKLNKLVRKIF